MILFLKGITQPEPIIAFFYPNECTKHRILVYRDNFLSIPCYPYYPGSLRCFIGLGYFLSSWFKNAFQCLITDLWKSINRIRYKLSVRLKSRRNRRAFQTELGPQLGRAWPFFNLLTITRRWNQIFFSHLSRPIWHWLTKN